MSNYQVRSYEDTYTIYELTDASTDSVVRVCPERGGIVIGCQLHGLELFYLDRDTFIHPTANIRGGNPVLFPICAQLKDAQYTWKGVTYPMANHGVARTSKWDVLGTSTEGEASITIALRSNETTRQSYPFDFELIFTYALVDGKLDIRQQYTNTGSGEAMPFYAGFHPYFNTDTKKIAYEIDATRYLDLNDNNEYPYEGVIDLTGKVESLTLLDAKTPSVSFPVSGGAKVTMSYDPIFKYVVVWHVEGKPFICVEPWMASTGELNRQEELVMLDAGQSLNANLTISCDR
ncbi:aldose epimerase [Paenibacillus protaetiae]|uniref:Aldose epimerase n=1 Tax=Paenibacillus protaetiae TaxID=2509456 RepID=A0A4P6EVX8_9BACL|nr:aldose epimerase [Paenibacillus protaetiae]QAY67164.1 aldose epimerase [Paenibacillus protaetiae]